jgi:hypothetical protein
MSSYVNAPASSDREQHISVVPAKELPADTTPCPACYDAIMRLENAVEAIARAIQSQTTSVSVQHMDAVQTGTQSAEDQSKPSFSAYRWIS